MSIISDTSQMTCSRGERQRMFYPKTDPDFSDTWLRALKTAAQQTVVDRQPDVATAAAAAGFAGPIELLALGTYHGVYRVKSPQPVIIRIAIPGLFECDRTLLLDKWARTWLRHSPAVWHLVPEVYAVHFGSGDLDFAVSACAAGRALDDADLDRNSDYLVSIGQALREVHGVEGDGAGLLALDGEEPPRKPTGVHEFWADYIDTRLEEHIAVLARDGYIDNDQARRIAQLFARARPALATRPMRLLHGDPGTRNMFFDPDTERLTALLDWEDALVGDPLFEVAMWSSFHPPRRMDAFLEGYGLPSPTAEERRLIALYFLRIALSKTVHRDRFAIADLPGREPGHHRILRGLEELEHLS